MNEELAHRSLQCWWCRYRTQTRDHLFKVCPELKVQQEILWAEVREESGRGKSRFKIQDLLADGRCSQAVPDFLSTMDVGRLAPAEEDAESDVPEWELRERRKREEERRVEDRGAGRRGGTTIVPAHALFHGIRGRE